MADDFYVMRWRMVGLATFVGIVWIAISVGLLSAVFGGSP